MNAKQMKVIWVTAGLVAIQAAYPPWLHLDRGFRVDCGYGLIFDPPILENSLSETANTIDITRLFVGMMAVVAIGAALFVTLKDRDNQSRWQQAACQSCGKPYAQSAKFCNGCGEKLV